MAHFYLSKRGAENANELTVPWRFAPESHARYHKDTNPDGLISFSTAENSYLKEELVEFVNKKIKIPATSFNYSCYNGGPVFPGLMASHINTHFSPHVPITAANILTAAGVCALQSMVAFSVGDEGDGVLVGRPVYGRFEVDYKTSARVKIIYADMNGVDLFCSSVVERFEDAIRKASAVGQRIKALLITNPSNPLGRCYPRETLIALMEFCQRHTIHLISDEVYALSVYSPPGCTSPTFTSILSIDTKNLIDPKLVHCLYGMSKDFGLAGLKIGCLISQNKGIIDCCKLLARFHGSSGPSLDVAIAILKEPDFVQHLLNISRERLREGHRITTTELDAASIPYYRGSNAGFFLFIDLSRYLVIWDSKKNVSENPEFALAQHIRDHGIYLHPREEHYEKPGWFRLVFSSMPPEELRVGLNRLITALKKIEIN